MEVSIIFKIAAVGIVVSILNQILKHNGRDDQAALTALAGLLIVIYWILPYILELFTTMKRLFELWDWNWKRVLRLLSCRISSINWICGMER